MPAVAVYDCRTRGSRATGIYLVNEVLHVELTRVSQADHSGGCLCQA